MAAAHNMSLANLQQAIANLSTTLAPTLLSQQNASTSTIPSNSNDSSSSFPIVQDNDHNQQPMTSIFTEPVSQTKLLASLVLFIITLICGYLPVKCLLNQNYIQYAMFAGGGVLMATAFCHLIPEAHDNYKFARTGAISASDSHAHLHNHHHNHDHHQLADAHQHHEQQSLMVNDSLAGASHLLPVFAAANNSTDSELEPAAAGGGSSDLNIPYLEITLCCGFFFMYLVEQLMVRFINNHTHEHPCDTSLGQLVVGNNGQDRNSASSVNNSVANSLNDPIPGSTAAIHLTASTSSSSSTSGLRGSEFYKFIRGLLIVSAFGAHSIFDGVAIGSQETVEKVWTIFLAISCHKLIIAAVVGLELYAATLESHLWTLVHLGIFSIMSPIGIILVVVAQNSFHLDSNHPAMILLQSFATGTLLYIVFVEILQPKEGQAYEKNRIGKSLSLIAGFALMLMVLTLIGEG